MGYTLFSIGERVRIQSGSFNGVEGIIAPPIERAESSGTIILSGASMLLPVTVAATLEGRAVSIRVPPELLERIA